jgi:sugar phosphate isomerase/epimerase
MLLSVATANLYFVPFPQVLETIVEAGFHHIEFDLYWERSPWAMAQHLKGVDLDEAVRLVGQAGLHVATIHDGGGVLEPNDGIGAYVNPALRELLDGLGYAPGCIVVHPPHVQGHQDESWWPGIAPTVAESLEGLKPFCDCVTVENIPAFDGYQVPLSDLSALRAFADEHDLGLTLDTTHCAQAGLDALEAAKLMRERIRTTHLSDYRGGATHVFVGEGDLDLPGVLATIAGPELHSVTLECSLAKVTQSAQVMSQARMVARLREAKERLDAWMAPWREDGP